MNDVDVALTLAYMRPGEAWHLTGNTIDGLVWLADTPAPTEAEIVAAWPEAQAATRAAAEQKAAARSALLERLGISEAEAALLREMV